MILRARVCADTRTTLVSSVENESLLIGKGREFESLEHGPRLSVV